MRSWAMITHGGKSVSKGVIEEEIILKKSPLARAATGENATKCVTQRSWGTSKPNCAGAASIRKELKRNCATNQT